MSAEQFSKEQLSAYLHEHKDEIFADLGYLVSFPSIKSAPAEGAPFGLDSARCLAACAELYRKNGFGTEVFADLGYALAYFGPKPEATDEYSVIMAHTDVVPVTPEDWTLTEPFKMLDTGENVVGRGVSDNKNAAIGVLYILRAMRDCGYKPKHTVCVFLGSNEEAGMVDVKNFKKNQKPFPKVCLVPDASFSVSFGERGGFHSDIKSKGKLESILSIDGGSAYNIVLGKLKCTFKKLPGLVDFLINNPKDFVKFAENDETIDVEVSGISAHAGRPFNGDSAFARFSSFFAAFDGFPEGDAHIIKECAAMLSDCYGINLGIENEDPDMGKLTCANGKVYTEDGCLVYTLDIRFGPGVDRDAYKLQLAQNVESRGFTANNSKGSKSFKIDPENPLSVAVIEAYRKASGKSDAMPFFMSGGTYSKHMQPESISFSTGVHVGGYSARMNLPAGHGGVHEADENLGKEELLKGLSILGMMLRDIDLAY